VLIKGEKEQFLSWLSWGVESEARSAERDQYLIRDHVVQNGKPRLVQTFRENSRLTTVSLDHFPQTATSQ
jgi:hypothetical protein